jgi:hypothetical protein
VGVSRERMTVPGFKESFACNLAKDSEKVR